MPTSQLERSFDIASVVSESSYQLRQQWPVESERVRQSTPAILDIAYGTGERQTLDVFHPQGTVSDSGWPTLVFIHGGYWQKLSKDDHSFIAESFTAHGIAVAVIGYTLCPPNTVRGIAEEVELAVVHLWNNANTLGLDRERFALAGHSAGGHLTAWCMTVDWTKRSMPRSPFIAATAISGLFDLGSLVPTTVNDALRLTNAEAHESSPAYRARLVDCTFTAVVGAGETDEFVRQNALIGQCWPEVNEWALADHDHFTIVNALGHDDNELFRHVAAPLI